MSTTYDQQRIRPAGLNTVFAHAASILPLKWVEIQASLMPVNIHWSTLIELTNLGH